MSKIAIAKPESKRTVLNKATGEAGRPLPEAVRVELEIRFSANLAGVRIHTDSLGDEIARSLDAEAVTLGQHIFFQSGKWKPETPDGMDLLVHETAHTLQHAGPFLNQPEASISQPGDAVERDADTQVNESAERPQTVEPHPVADGTAARRVAGIAPREKHAADPARTIEELGRMLLQKTRADSLDHSGRIRNQLIRMEDNLRRDVLRWLEDHMESHEWRSFVHLLAEEPPAGTESSEDAQTKEVASARPAEQAGETGAEAAEQATQDKANPKPGTLGKDGKEKSSDQKKAGSTAGGAAGRKTLSPEEAAVEGAVAAKEGTEENAVAKPAIEQQEAATEAAGAGTAEAASAPPQQAQAPAGPTISVPPAPAEEPAGGGAGSVAAGTESPATAPVQEEASSRAEAAVETEASSTSPAEEAGSAAGQVPQNETPESASASSTAAVGSEVSATDSTSTTEDAGSEAVGSETETSPEGSSGSAAGEAVASAAETQAPSPENDYADATPPPVPEPAAESESEPATTTSATPQGGAAEITSSGATEASEQVSEPGIGAESASAEAAGGAAAEPATPAPAPGALPPGLLGEFSGEPSDAEPPAASGGGGGGGAAAAAPPPPPEPAVADAIPAADPAGAMSALGSMKVGPASHAVGAAAATVSAKTDEQRADLAAHPPTIERPTGSPQGAAGVTAGNVPKSPPGGAPKAAAAVAAGAPVAIAPPQPAPVPGASVTSKLGPPQVTGTAEGKLSQADVQRVEESVENMPTTDEALNVTAGEAPALPLEGDADPAQADKQQTALMDSAATNLEEGAQEAAAPMGEDHIYPKVTPGTITPDPSGSCDCGGGQASKAAGEGGAKAAGKNDSQEMGIEAVADQESGDQVRQAANDAAGEVTTDQQQQATEEAQANTDSQQQVTAAIEDNARQQSAERTQARKEVQDSRKEWTEGQQDAVDTARDDSADAVKNARGDIADEQKAANKKASDHIADGNKKIDDARVESEQKARAEKEKAKREEDDGGILGWISSKVSSFFSALRDAIHAVFDFARKLVKDAIELAQKLAHEVIDLARKAVVGLIKAAGELVASIGDVLLAAFPELRKKFRAAIEKAVDEAVDVVNKLADALDKGIKALLNGLLTALNAILCAYETLLNAIVDKVASVIKGAIAAARAIIAAFGMFAALVGDIAAGPGQWLSNLASSVMDGIKNHLWTALKTAVKQWFNDMVEGIIGMGKMLLDFLRKGGLSLKKIAGFVWQAIISALPGIIIQFLIERLIAMIIPAAGAIVAVIQGLVAAWGAIQRIIAAFQLFFIFLKAVKNGGAGPQFATALAASAIAVLQFLANFLISRLGKAAGGVTSKLKAIAQKIMAFFKRVGKGALKVIRKVGGAIVRGAKAVGRVVKRGAKAVARVIQRGIKAVGRVVRKVLSKTKVGRKILNTYDNAKKKIGEYREKFKQWREGRKKKRRENAEKRLAAAIREIPPILESAAGGRGIRGALLWARLKLLQVRYLLRSLRVNRSGSGYTLTARVNPTDTAKLNLVHVGDELLREIVRDAVNKIMLSDEVAQADEAMDPNKPVINHPRDYLAYIRRFSSGTNKPLLAGEKRFVQVAKGVITYETGPRSGATVTNQFVGSGSTYKTLLQRFNNLKSKHQLTNREMSENLENLVRHQELSGPMQKGTAYKDLALLAFGREGVRNPSTAAHSVMALDLMKSGRISPEQAFGLAGSPSDAGIPQVIEDANPATRNMQENQFREKFLRPSNDPAMAGPQNAGAATAVEERNRAPRTDIGGANRATQEQHNAREAALIRQWLELKAEAWVFDSLSHAREVLTEVIMARLENFYRLRGIYTTRK